MGPTSAASCSGSTEGEQLALQMKRAVSRAQQRIVGPLDGAERTHFGVLLGKLVAGHEAAARHEALHAVPDAPAQPLKRQASKKEAF